MKDIPRPKILLVDDTPANRVAARLLLSKAGADLIEAMDGHSALSACLEHEFALILLDVQMPDMDGFEVAQLLSEEESTREVPIIFVTATVQDDLSRIKAYGSGAVDFITKPVNDAILRSKVKVFLELWRGKQQLRAALAQIELRNRDLESEVRARQEAERAARHQATHDPLTGLPNRLLFLDRLQNTMERARRRKGVAALLYVDIDGFKPVNDQHGHPLGDELLKAIARRMEEVMRKVDTVARLGGDEFAIVMEEPSDLDHVVASAERVKRRIAETFRLPAPDAATGWIEVKVGASIGVALYPQHGADVETLIRAADHAMYDAKRGGKNRCVVAG